MPIWLELMVLLLLTYAAGLAIGWSLWRRVPSETRNENDG